MQGHRAGRFYSSHAVRSAALGAAVLAGLAATVLTRDELEPGRRSSIASTACHSLPAVGFSLLCGAGGHTPAAREFGRLVLDMAELPQAPDKWAKRAQELEIITRLRPARLAS